MPNFSEQNLADNNLPESVKETAVREQIIADLERTGLKKPVSEEVINRLVLLDKNSKFYDDDQQVEKGMANVLDYLAKYRATEHPEFILTAERKIDSLLAAKLHDIGKSGPAEATLKQQEAVAKLYAIERINGTDRLVKEIVAENFSDNEAEELLGNLAACGIEPEMTIKQFWNRHACWTYNILEKYPAGLNDHVRIIAGSHHIDNGIDPYDPSGRKTFLEPGMIKTRGDEIDDYSERVLIVVDRYQAAVRRSHLDHEAAINWVRSNMAKYDKDDLLKLIIDAADKLGKQGKIFS